MVKGLDGESSESIRSRFEQIGEGQQHTQKTQDAFKKVNLQGRTWQRFDPGTTKSGKTDKQTTSEKLDTLDTQPWKTVVDRIGQKMTVLNARLEKLEKELGNTSAKSKEGKLVRRVYQKEIAVLTRLKRKLNEQHRRASQLSERAQSLASRCESVKDKAIAMMNPSRNQVFRRAARRFTKERVNTKVSTMTREVGDAILKRQKELVSVAGQFTETSAKIDRVTSSMDKTRELIDSVQDQQKAIDEHLPFLTQKGISKRFCTDKLAERLKICQHQLTQLRSQLKELAGLNAGIKGFMSASGSNDQVKSQQTDISNQLAEIQAESAKLQAATRAIGRVGEDNGLLKKDTSTDSLALSKQLFAQLASPDDIANNPDQAYVPMLHAVRQLRGALGKQLNGLKRSSRKGVGHELLRKEVESRLQAVDRLENEMLKAFVGLSHGEQAQYDFGTMQELRVQLLKQATVVDQLSTHRDALLQSGVRQADTKQLDVQLRMLEGVYSASLDQVAEQLFLSLQLDRLQSEMKGDFRSSPADVLKHTVLQEVSKQQDIEQLAMRARSRMLKQDSAAIMQLLTGAIGGLGTQKSWSLPNLEASRTRTQQHQEYYVSVGMKRAARLPLLSKLEEISQITENEVRAETLSSFCRQMGSEEGSNAAAVKTQLGELLLDQQRQVFKAGAFAQVAGQMEFKGASKAEKEVFQALGSAMGEYSRAGEAFVRKLEEMMIDIGTFPGEEDGLESKVTVFLQSLASLPEFEAYSATYERVMSLSEDVADLLASTPEQKAKEWEAEFVELITDESVGFTVESGGDFAQGSALTTVPGIGAQAPTRIPLNLRDLDKKLKKLLGADQSPPSLQQALQSCETPAKQANEAVKTRATHFVDTALGKVGTPQRVKVDGKIGKKMDVTSSDYMAASDYEEKNKALQSVDVTQLAKSIVGWRQWSKLSWSEQNAIKKYAGKGLEDIRAGRYKSSSS